MHLLLRYDYTADYLERRGAFRDEHLRLGWEASDAGLLVLGGVVGDPPTGALFVFTADDDAPVRAFAEADPYVVNGLVTRWDVQPWSTAIGVTASSPVRPAG